MVFANNHDFYPYYPRGLLCAVYFIIFLILTLTITTIVVLSFYKGPKPESAYPSLHPFGEEENGGTHEKENHQYTETPNYPVVRAKRGFNHVSNTFRSYWWETSNTTQKPKTHRYPGL